MFNHDDIFLILVHAFSICYVFEANLLERGNKRNIYKQINLQYLKNAFY